MAEACMYEIMEVSPETLRRVIPNASARMLSRLISAYPRAIGRTLLKLVSETMSPAAFQFLNDQIVSGVCPPWSQVRAAESEFIKMLHDIGPVPAPSLAN